MERRFPNVLVMIRVRVFSAIYGFISPFPRGKSFHNVHGPHRAFLFHCSPNPSLHFQLQKSLRR